MTKIGLRYVFNHVNQHDAANTRLPEDPWIAYVISAYFSIVQSSSKSN